ncbi:MAG: hypothetical protein ACM3MJ_08895 [Deltaproteobacteria bacterium]
MTCRGILLTVLGAVVVLSGCGGAPSPSRSPAPGEPLVKGFVFSWGPHKPKNVLDTVHGTFTKDMVLASPLTVPFRLDSAEVADIARRVAAIDFWSYPAHYVSHGSGPRFEPPAGFENSASLTVVTHQGSKTVEWSGGYYADDGRAQALHELAAYITRLVVSSPQYERLPPAEGGYL